MDQGNHDQAVSFGTKHNAERVAAKRKVPAFAVNEGEPTRVREDLVQSCVNGRAKAEGRAFTAMAIPVERHVEVHPGLGEVFNFLAHGEAALGPPRGLATKALSL